MKIFNGKKEIEKILKDLKAKIKKGKKKPVLKIFYIGKNSGSDLYIKNKKIVAKKIGIVVFCYRFKENAKENDIIDKIKLNNKYPSVDGIIVQLPLPKKFNTERIINSLNPKKDVDGFHEINRKLLKNNRQYFEPVLPHAISIVLKSALRNLKGKKIIALVNSDIFGQTLKNFFENKKIKIKYIISKKISEIKSSLKSADVIISACGNPRFIKGEMIKKGAILIDAGINFINGKLLGDVDRESVVKKASFLTPVPGGIGPFTVALLLKNVYKANQFKK
jgi:5,10-methylene-tetrahydrofolate dehydrogenase/methenyl tetrahydrofolate cyclohydrolase